MHIIVESELPDDEMYPVAIGFSQIYALYFFFKVGHLTLESIMPIFVCSTAVVRLCNYYCLHCLLLTAFAAVSAAGYQT